MVADFSFKKSGLSVEFINNSTGDPDSFLWKFGDGSESIEEEPQHTYEKTGLYRVELTISKDGSPNNPVKKWVGVNEDSEILVLDQPVTELLKLYIPNALLNNEEYEFDNNLSIQKWQMFLQPLVERTIPNDYVFNQSAYTALENYLIAQLVARDCIINGANQYLAQFNAAALNEQGEVGQELKMVKTGPSEAQWYASSEMWSDIMAENGTLSLLTHAICTMGHRLRINFHFCIALSTNTVVPQNYKRPKERITNPFEKTRL